MTKACLQSSTTMCYDAKHTCEKVAGTEAGAILDGTADADRLVSDPLSHSVISGFDGDDILIGRAAQDFLDGGDGDDIFYMTPRNTVSVTTGGGKDIVVIDELAPTPTSFIKITDLDENDTIRFYNPTTRKYVDVPYNNAKDGILNVKSGKDLVSPELQVGIFEFATVTAFICDETSDIVSLCYAIDLTDANNNSLAADSGSRGTLV